MGEETLVEGLFEDSSNLVKKLDSDGNAPVFVVWYFYEDANEWRLLVGGPPFDQLLPKEEPLAYQTISEAISELDLSTLSISLVKLVKMDEPLPKAVKFLIRTGADSTMDAHFMNTTLNGIFIKEMFVMRSA